MPTCVSLQVGLQAEREGQKRKRRLSHNSLSYLQAPFECLSAAEMVGNWARLQKKYQRQQQQ